MQFAVLSQAFDGGDLVSLMHDGKRQARIYAASVYVHCTCAALAMVATFLRAGKLEVFAQRIKKGDARLQRDMVVFSIDIEHHRHRARNVSTRDRFGGWLRLLYWSRMEPWGGCDGWGCGPEVP